jgi:RNA polymerase sigma-70 factor (ECF subfamily)
VTNVNNLEVRLVERAASGDRDACRELFERYRNMAFRVAIQIVGNEADALDVLQEGFIKAFQGLSGFLGESGFKTWFLRIVSNTALDALRTRRIRKAASLDEDDRPVDLRNPRDPRPAEAMSREELGGRLRRAIDELPPAQRSVFALYAAGELTYGEIAEIVGVPIGTVMSRIHHARRQLHDSLADLAPRGHKRGSA